MYVPGPGAYEAVRPQSQLEKRRHSEGKNSYEKNGFGTTSERFNYPKERATLGPGHYSAGTDMMGKKRSFNSTITDLQ